MTSSHMPIEPMALPLPLDHATFDNLPDIPALNELKSLDHWVAWNYEPKPGASKLAKIPKNPRNGFNASSTKPETWGSYALAAKCASARRFSGVGFVLTDGDGYTGIDLDDCIDIDTNEPAPWAQAILDLRETYAEISPSGSGIRLWVRGKIASGTGKGKSRPDLTDDHGRPRHDVEVYVNGRYLTVTGHRWPASPDTINEAPRTLAALCSLMMPDAAPPSLTPANITRVVLPAPSGGDFFRQVNGAALASLSSWVPSIFPGAKHAGGTGAWRVSPRDLGRDTEEDLSIAPNGIRDWGIHDLGDARQGRRTAIDIVMEYGGAPDPKSAAIWLCGRVGRDPVAMGLREARQIDTGIAEGLLGEINEPPSEARKAVLASTSLGDGVDWTKPKGLMADIADWIMATSRRPNRPLAVASAASVMSVVCGRHLYGPTGLPLNLYVITLADTAVGKARPLSAVYEVLKAARLAQLHDTLNAFSVSAIQDMVCEKPCVIATSDEIGENFLKRISNRKASTHEAGMKAVVMELFGRQRGDAPYTTHRRAQKAPVEVHQPSLSIYGASTPEAFYASITEQSVSDGFLNRFLIAHAAPRARAQDVPDELKTVPESIVRRLMAIVPTPSGGDIAQALGVFSGLVAPDSRRLEWDGEAGIAQMEFEESILDAGDGQPAVVRHLTGRVSDYTTRLASLHAVSRAGRNAKVNVDDLAWGAAWAKTSAALMIDGATNLMASSDYEAKLNAISKVVRDAGTIGKRELLRQVRSISARDRDDILKHLIEAGLVRLGEVKTTGRPGMVYQWTG